MPSASGNHHNPKAGSWGALKAPKYSCTIPEGPSSQYLRTLVPNTIKGMVFGTRVLKYWVLGPSKYINMEAIPGLVLKPESLNGQYMDLLGNIHSYHSPGDLARSRHILI